MNTQDVTVSVLQDHLAPNLDAVFCGTAPSEASARMKAYYAKSGNRFWPILHETGITSRRYLPCEYREIIHLGLGLTDLCKTHSGIDSSLPKGVFDIDRLQVNLLNYQPRLVVFTSLTAGKIYLKRNVTLGLQTETIRDTRIFVCCSTSGLNAHWNRQKQSWFELAKLLHDIGASLRLQGGTEHVC